MLSLHKKLGLIIREIYIIKMKYIYSIVIFLIAMPLFAQRVEEREFNLAFGEFSDILYPAYMNNESELSEIHRIISEDKNSILAGECYIALVSNIRPGDKGNGAKINRASITGSVVRAFFKVRYGLSDSHFTFCFDDGRDLENNVKVSFINGAIPAGANRYIYYTQNDYNYNYVMMQYGTIPICRGSVVQNSDDIVIPAAVDTSMVVTEAVRPNVEPERPADKRGEEVKKEENKVVYVEPSDNIKTKRNRIKRDDGDYYPLIALKSNALFWAGYTPFIYDDFFGMEPASSEFGYMLPNLEGEYYFNGRFSIAGDGAYMVNKYGNDYWWKVSSYSLEPRIWVGQKGLYKGLYIGLFGIVGDYDMKREKDVNNYGYTGNQYGGGLSLGYLQPIYKGLAFEIGIRGGYHYIDRESYIVNSGVYHLQSSDSMDGFRILGARVSLVYRFRK